MADTRQAIIESIDRMQQALEQMEAENQFQQGDTVSYSHEGNEGVAVIESVSEQGYTIRVMAVAGDSYEPTDDVYVVGADALSPMENDSGQTPDTGDADEDQPEQSDPPDDNDEDEELEKSMFVQWNSKYGPTIGRIADMTSDKTIVVAENGDQVENPKGEKRAVLEVFEKHDGRYEATGVHVVIPAKGLQAIEPVDVAPRKIMMKVKNAEMSHDEEKNVGWLEGIGSAYGKVDLGGDTVAKGAYKQTIAHNSGKIQLSVDHGFRVKDVVGVAYIEDSDEGLVTKSKMPLHIPHVKDAYEMAKFMIDEGKPLGYSIEYNPVKAEPGQGGTRVLKEVALEGMTITPWPMDTVARIREAKSRKILYNTKRRGWQTLAPTKSDAPTGNQDDRDEYQSLGSFLHEIKTHMEKKNEI